MPTQVPVLVVCTNEADDLERWLANVQSMRTDDVEPIPYVADNASWDRTPGVLWDAIHSGQVEAANVLWLHANLGFSAAQNQLIRAVGTANKYDHFATLNIDACANSDWLVKLVAKATISGDKKIGMWSGLIFESGTGPRLSSASHTLRKDGAFLDIDRKAGAADHKYSNDAEFEPFCPCFAASLWSLKMVREAGLPDSGQFLTYDDTEIGFKARILGWQAQFVRDAIARHPIPNSKQTIDTKRVYQARGKMLTVLRYLPDLEVRDFVVSLNADERQILDSIDSRLRLPFGSDDARRSVYTSWSGKYPGNNA